MYRIIFTILFFIYFVKLNFCFSQNVKYKFTIDVRKNDTLKLSQIGIVKKTIPLEETKLKQVLDSNPVVIDGENIFITFGYFPKEICNYDLNGNLKNKITIDENLIKGSLYFQCDTINNLLFLRSMSDTVYCLNYSGKILKKLKVSHRPPFYFYNKMIWGTVHQNKDTYEIYSLYSTNKNGENTFIWKIRNELTLADNMKPVRLLPSFSSSSNALFFSMYFDQTIYKIENSKMTPFVKFQFENGQPNYDDYISSFPTIINGKWIIAGYRFQQKRFSYIYNTVTNKSYNLADKKIIDDVFYTDDLNATIFKNMSNGHIALLVPARLLKNTNFKKDREIALVLMKID